MPSEIKTSGTGGQSGSGVAWTLPANVTDSDDVYATVTLAAGEYSKWLTWTPATPFAVPTAGVVDGSIVEVECKASDAEVIAGQPGAALLIGGVIQDATSKLLGGETIETTESYLATGSEADNWQLSLTPAIANAVNFGCAVCVIGSGAGGTFSVDHIRQTMYWSLPLSAGPLIRTRRGLMPLHRVRG